MGFDKLNSEIVQQPEKSQKTKTISRRQFLKLTGLALGSAFLTACGISPPAQEPSLPSQPKSTELNPELNPELSRVLNGFDSTFNIFQTTGLPERMKTDQKVEPEIYQADQILRANLQLRFQDLPPNQDGKDLIIQSLGCPHNVHNSTFFLEQGFDVYYNFNPVQTEHGSETRVLDVMKHDIDRVEKAKEKLIEKGVEQIRGFVLNYDEHSSDYLASESVDETFPDIDTLKKLGVNRLIFVGEFSPKREERIAVQIGDNSYSPQDRLIDFIQKCQNSGIEVLVWGIDTRHDIEGVLPGLISPESFNPETLNLETVNLEDGSIVLFGGYSPDSNPRIITSNGTLMRILGGEIQIIPPDDPLGRKATQEESEYYYDTIDEARKPE